MPDELTVVISGRPDYFDLFGPELTVVKLPLPEMAGTAARLLIDNLERGQGEARPPQQIILEPTLHLGASVGAPT